MGDPKDYLIVARYLVKDEGWRCEEIKVANVSFREAGRQATVKARELDITYGDDHFWTVDLFDDPKGTYGSYCQLFHGRVS